MKNIIIAAAATTLMAGCTSDHAPLFFGQTQTAGIAIGVNPATSVPEITVGYKDANIANVPTAIMQPDGSFLPLNGAAQVGENRTEDSGNERDAYSTFGQFDVNVGTGSSVSQKNEGSSGAVGSQTVPSGSTPDAKIALGKFFATGLAARYLAQGFACDVSGGSHSTCKFEVTR